MTWLATFDGFVQFDDATEKIKVRDQYSNNKLKPSEECFAPYGGNYTYIVVEVYYGGEATPVQKIIKIKAADPLFNLTQNNTNCFSISERFQLQTSISFVAEYTGLNFLGS